MLENLQTHRQILFDLTANYLDPLPGPFERLAYLSGLRDTASGKYVQEQLATVYGGERVDQVAACCHEEVFERLLEMPLSSQEEALRRYVASLPGTFPENLENCRQLACHWAPPTAPSYLTELYFSNLGALLVLLADNMTKVRPGK
jgi:hypothetical protein